MDALNTILNSSVLGNFLWVALIIVVLLVFRKELIGLLTRVKEAEWGLRKLKFTEPRMQPHHQAQRVSREGAFFHFGLSLMFTAFKIYQGRGNEDILKTLASTASYANDCGLQKQADVLEKLRERLQTQPCALSLEDKKALGDNLVALREDISQHLAIE